MNEATKVYRRFIKILTVTNVIALVSLMSLAGWLARIQNEDRARIRCISACVEASGDAKRCGVACNKD